MSHELEQFEGKTAFALRGAPAWHGLANALFNEGDHVTTQDMLDSAFMSNWNVRTELITPPEGYNSVKDYFNVVRTNPFHGGNDILGVVQNRYKPFQNEELFSFADNIIDGAGAWESAGSIKNGTQVFGSIKFDRELILDANGVADRTETYLLVTTSHDGSGSIRALVTPVRVVCQNTLNMALNGATQSFLIRHTQGTQGRVEEARRVLGLTFKHMDKFDVMAQELFKTAITDDQFRALVETVYPKPEVTAKASLTKWTEKSDFITALYLNSPTQAGITGTAWGALNALTEYVDYYRTSGAPSEGVLGAASGFESGINTKKGEILQAVRTLALV